MSLSASTALDASVLVLNKFFMAVHVISVRRAFGLQLGVASHLSSGLFHGTFGLLGGTGDPVFVHKTLL